MRKKIIKKGLIALSKTRFKRVSTSIRNNKKDEFYIINTCNNQLLHAPQKGANLPRLINQNQVVKKFVVIS